jgi:SAM-dependent methyltransferase
MKAGRWYETQRAYYDGRVHRHLQPSEGGVYAENIVAKLWSALGLGAGGHGLEVGCGAGRFTLPLLSRCGSLDAVDLSSRQLGVLGDELKRRGIDETRCRLHQANIANIEELDRLLGSRQYDFVVGVFILHHLHDPTAALAQLYRLLRPGARAAFLEPNRWNPLFFLQISLCPDMTWRDEWRLFRLGAHQLRTMFADAGLTECRTTRVGFWPPRIVNRFPRAVSFERYIERIGWLAPARAFVVASGARPVS